MRLPKTEKTSRKLPPLPKLLALIWHACMWWLAHAKELSEDIINPSGPSQTDGMMENQQATYSLMTIFAISFLIKRNKIERSLNRFWNTKNLYQELKINTQPPNPTFPLENMIR